VQIQQGGKTASLTSPSQLSQIYRPHCAQTEQSGEIALLISLSQRFHFHFVAGPNLDHVYRSVLRLIQIYFEGELCPVIRESNRTLVVPLSDIGCVRGHGGVVEARPPRIADSSSRNAGTISSALTAFRKRSTQSRSRSFASWTQSLNHSPNSNELC
jgi:hypothetical protein